MIAPIKGHCLIVIKRTGIEKHIFICHNSGRDTADSSPFVHLCLMTIIESVKM